MVLFRKVEATPGESLSGLVARAAGLNVYPRASDILEQAGIPRFKPQSIANRDPSLASDLAAVLEIAPETIEGMFQRSFGDGKSIDFYGVRLRSIHRELDLRRVSPRALRISPHVRAVWHIRPFSFDPATKERLISSCPVCQEPLGFLYTRGIAFCDHCLQQNEIGLRRSSVDLRDFPQDIVEVADVEALDFVTGLVDPDPVVRAGFAPSLADEISGFDRSELFEMALSIASAVAKNADAAYVPEAAIPYRVHWSAVQPSHLEIAGRAVLDWPRAYFDLLDAAAANKEQRENALWGSKKEFGAFGVVHDDPFLSRRVRSALKRQSQHFFIEKPIGTAEVRRADARDQDVFVGARELRSWVGVGADVVAALGRHPGVLKFRNAPAPAPVMFDRYEVKAIFRRYKDMISEGSVAFGLGVPVETVRDLSHGGYLKQYDGPEVDLVEPEVNYSKDTYDFFFEYFAQEAPLGGREDGFIPFSEVMLRFPAVRRPWFALWELVISGRINGCVHREPTKSITEVICVREQSIDYSKLAARMAEMPDHDLAAVTIGSARLSLGLQSYPVFTAAVEGQLFKLNDDKTVPYRQVLEFGRNFVLTNEIAARSGIGRVKLRDWLADRGVKPWRDLGVKGGLIYERSEVERLLRE